MLLVPWLALLLVAAPQSDAPGNNASAADQNCTVSGRVSNSLTGEPLRKASVQLMPHGVAVVVADSGARVHGAASSGGYSTTSLADGSFSFENVKPGDYTLYGQHNGYLVTQFGAKRPSAAGTVITLKAGQQKTGLVFPLLPQAVITGKVVDEDGDPLNGVMVQAIRPQWVQGGMNDMPEASAQTNDLGEFRLSGVRPGKCYLLAQKMNFDSFDGVQPTDSGKPQTSPVRTFYPEAASRDAATPLELQAGQDLAGIDIRMRSSATYHVRGKIAGVTFEGDDFVMVSVRTPHDQFAFYGRNQVRVGKAQTFDIAHVAPGSYELVLQNMSGKTHFAATQPIEVGSGDLNNVVLLVQAPATVKGRIQVQGSASGASTAINLSSIHFTLVPADFAMAIGRAPTANPSEDGAFTLENLTPGKFKLAVDAPSGTYVQSARFGAQDVLGKYLDVSSGAAGELELVFRSGAAQVNGTIQEWTSAPQAPVNANVLLVPAELNEDGSGLAFRTTDSSGAFSFKKVSPGSYKVYAFEDATYNDLQNPEVIKALEGKGVELEVKENDTKQIQLPLISSSDFQQLLTRLGIEPTQ